MTSIDQAFDDLAHSLRRLLEANYYAHAGGLLVVDRAEAIGNIEIAFTSVLNSFHSLYDAMNVIFEEKSFRWYESGPVATLLAIRNARHHNKARKIRSLYSYHVQETENPSKMKSYILVNFPPSDPEASTFDLYFSWYDLNALLRMKSNESHLRLNAVSTIKLYLKSDKFLEYESYYDLKEESVFVNAIPIIVDAAMCLVPLISEQLKTFSTEGETYKFLFSNPAMSMNDKPEVKCGPIVLPPQN